MSRGPGTVQRATLATLAGDPERWFALPFLTAYVGVKLGRGDFNESARDRALTESVRRAVRALERLGYAESCRRASFWAGFYGLHVRLRAEHLSALSELTGVPQ